MSNQNPIAQANAGPGPNQATLDVTVKFVNTGNAKTVASQVKVIVKSADDGKVILTSDAPAGTARLANLAPGKYDLSVELTQAQSVTYAPPLMRVEPKAGETRAVDLEVLARGTLKVAVEKPSQPVTVTVAGPESRTATTAADGQVSFSNLPSGDYTVTLAFPPGSNDAKLRISRAAPVGGPPPPAGQTDSRGSLQKVTVPAGETVSVGFVLEAPYEKVQFIGYGIRTGKYIGTDDPAKFGSDKEKAAQDDIEKRCAIMRETIRAARAIQGVEANDRKVLKVFMAPEFYFRGKQGAYPLQTVPQILDELTKETGAKDYEDWLFVFGTALGYLDQGQASYTANVSAGSVNTSFAIDNPPANSAQANVAAGWKLKVTDGSVPPTTYNVLSVRPDQGVLYIKVDKELSFQPNATLEVWDNSTPTPKGGAVTLTWDLKWTEMEVECQAPVAQGWQVKNAKGESIFIQDATSTGGNKYEIQLRGPLAEAFAASPVTLVDFGETEIFNLALVQKGGPNAPVGADGSVLKEVVVYKEWISAIDFEGPDFGKTDFYDIKRHLIKIHGDPLRRVIPTEGSTDTLGTNPRPAGPSAQGQVSEINRTGLGGGSVFTVDGITFGLEVCLDHAEGRLFDYYDKKHAASGEPKVQVQLLPSCGMDIKYAYGVQSGPIFNVDKTHVVLAQNGTNLSKLAVSGAPTTPDVSTCFDTNANKALAPSASENGYIAVYSSLAIPPAERVP